LPPGLLDGPENVTHPFVDVHPLAGLPYASSAATVTVNAWPAVCEPGFVRVKWSRPAPLTATLSLPVALVVTVSFTVTVIVPAVASVTLENVCTPLSDAVNV